LGDEKPGLNEFGFFVLKRKKKAYRFKPNVYEKVKAANRLGVTIKKAWLVARLFFGPSIKTYTLLF